MKENNLKSVFSKICSGKKIKMFRANDVWERLVSAVLKRQHDREIAMCPSSSSFSSESSSFNPTNHGLIGLQSEYQHDQSLVLEKIDESLPSDYSDLKMDHEDWKMMLPHGESVVTMESCSMSFFLDQSTGKNCFMLGICNSIGAEPASSKSRFSAVNRIKYPRQFQVSWRIETRMLSPETRYAAYLVFDVEDDDDGMYYQYLETSMAGVTLLDDKFDCGYSREKLRTVLFRDRERRDDGWNEVVLGLFHVTDEWKRAAVSVRLFNELIVDHDRNIDASHEDSDWSDGDDHDGLVMDFDEINVCRRYKLIIEGVEFRPFIPKPNNTNEKRSNIDI